MRALAAALHDAIAITDADGYILEWNQPAAALFGYEPSVASGMLVTKLLAGEEVSLQEVVAAAPDGANAREEKRVVELLAARRDGSIFQCELSSTTFRVGSESHCVLVFRDIAERSRAQLALQQSEDKYRALALYAPVGILETDARGNTTFVNRRWTEITGYTQDEAIRNGWQHNVHPDDVARISTTASAAFAAGVSLSIDYRLISKSGEIAWVNGSSVRLTDPYGVITGYLSSIVDVTIRKRALEALASSLHEKEVLLKEIHHRVKNNLQVIVSLINLQASKLEDPATRTAFEETRNRVHAIALLHERLYGSKNLGRIDMGDYLSGLASDLSSTNLDPRPIALHVEAEDLYFAVDAAVPVGLIVNELVTNAYKHAFPPGLRQRGHIRVQLQRQAEMVAITVSDDGVGYPAKLDPSTSDTLGLLLITSLSKQLAGEATFEHDRNGARCVVRFPAHGAEASAPATTAR